MSRQAKRWMSGSVCLTGWPDDKASERLGFPVMRFKIERRFKNKKGDWHSSPTFFKRDLHDVQIVCRLAYEELSVRHRILELKETPKAQLPAQSASNSG